MYIFGDNHGRDIESRQLPKIMAQGENHGNHGDREFVIYIHPYLYSRPEIREPCYGFMGYSSSQNCFNVECLMKIKDIYLDFKTIR